MKVLFILLQLKELQICCIFVLDNYFPIRASLSTNVYMHEISTMLIWWFYSLSDWFSEAYLLRGDYKESSVYMQKSYLRMRNCGFVCSYNYCDWSGKPPLRLLFIAYFEHMGRSGHAFLLLICHPGMFNCLIFISWMQRPSRKIDFKNNNIRNLLLKASSNLFSKSRISWPYLFMLKIFNYFFKNFFLIHHPK